MQTPKSNEKNIRNASIYMYDVSSQYRRLIQYYALMPTWAYTVSPLDFDSEKVNETTFRKAYLKSAQQVEKMNLKHEMQKAVIIALREGVLYGVQLTGTDSFCIQRINPDYCKLSALLDGTWLYAVDFSQIREDELYQYPPEFTTLWNTYQKTGQKWQEIPDNISFCLKADETTSLYSIPPWSSAMPLLYDIETYKALQETASEIANTKMIGMTLPTDEKGIPLMEFPEAQKYYTHLLNAVPPNIGVAMSPMKLDAFDFSTSSNLSDVDTVSKSEEAFWRESGTSPLLFGSSDNDSAGALQLSIIADTEIVFAIVNQCERLINRILKSLGGTQKFRINFLDRKSVV